MTKPPCEVFREAEERLSRLAEYGDRTPSVFFDKRTGMVFSNAALLAKGRPMDERALCGTNELSDFRLADTGMLTAKFCDDYIRGLVTFIAGEACFDVELKLGDPLFFEKALLVRAGRKLKRGGRVEPGDTDALLAVRTYYSLCGRGANNVTELCSAIEKRLDHALLNVQCRYDDLVCEALAAALGKAISSRN